MQNEIFYLLSLRMAACQKMWLVFLNPFSYFYSQGSAIASSKTLTSGKYTSAYNISRWKTFCTYMYIIIKFIQKLWIWWERRSWTLGQRLVHCNAVLPLSGKISPSLFVRIEKGKFLLILMQPINQSMLISQAKTHRIFQFAIAHLLVLILTLHWTGRVSCWAS